MSIDPDRWTLKPISTPLVERYTRNSHVTVSHRTVSTGLFSAMDAPHPIYLPELWNVNTNPEGSIYFSRHSRPIVITEANIYDSTVLRQLLQALNYVEDKVKGFESAILDSTEIFLQLEADETCSYYLVDHSLRVQFWLEEVSTEGIGLRSSASYDHLRLDIERLYWMHVEYFPAHNSPRLNLCIDNLIEIIIQARTDNMTSSTSTFPYNVDECAHFIQILRSLQDGPQSSAYRIWSVARIWQNVVDQRFIGHYGQDTARLASNLSILNVDVPSKTLIFKAFNIMGLRTPGTYLRLLNEQWLDRVVQSQRWGAFMSTSQAEWKTSMILSIAFLICNLLLLNSSTEYSTAVLIATVLLCDFVIGLVILLILKLGPMAGVDKASDISDYLSSADKKYFGLQITAVIFSLPRVFTLWAFVLSSMQIVVVTLGLVPAAICVGGAILAGLVMWAWSRIYEIVLSNSGLLNYGKVWYSLRACFDRSTVKRSATAVQRSSY